MLDLIDNTIEPINVTHVNDNVNGYTVQQIFAALQPDVVSIPQFKTKLLLQNPANPTNGQMTALFTSYGY